MVESLAQLHLADSRGADDPRQGGVFMESGYAKTQSQKAIAAKPGPCIRAVGKTRRVTSRTCALPTPTAQPWGHIATVLRPQRWRTWPTIRMPTNGTKRKRMEFRTRDPRGSLRDGGQVQGGCSNPRTRPDGRRKEFAGNAMRVTARQLMLGYRLRWAMALCQKTGQPSLGFEEVATRGWASGMSHVPWVYGASRWLAMSPPGGSAGVTSLGDAQRQLQPLLANQEQRRMLQKLPQLGGVQRYQEALRQALAGA